MLEDLYDLYLNCTGISTDTRTTQPGNLYFALKGPSFNGNLFAEKALEAGAIAVIIDEEIELPKTATIFLVNDVLTTLQKLANLHRIKSEKVQFIGLTGSNGKTTGKELFNSVLSTTYKTHATKGNLNNHIGVPLTILSMPKDTEIAIIEMGANHRGEIHELSNIALPHIGYITNFGKAHLDGFGGFEGVIQGKTELYQNLKENKGIALVNTFDEIQVSKSMDMERITYGITESDYPMTFMETNYPAAVECEGMLFSSQLTGNFNAANIGAAIAIGKHFNIEESLIQRGISAYHPQNNRSQWTTTSTNRVMLDAYNANPSSMMASIQSFIQEADGRKVLILGDMFELGSASLQEHQFIVDYLLKVDSLEVILVGEWFAKTNHGPFLCFKSTEECETHIQNNQIKNSSILLKGSRGMHLETLYSNL